MEMTTIDTVTKQNQLEKENHLLRTALRQIIAISYEDYGPACSARMFDVARAALRNVKAKP